MKKKSYYQPLENSWSQDYFLYGQTPFSAGSMTFLFRSEPTPIHESSINHTDSISRISSSAITASPIISVGPNVIESADAVGGVSTSYSLLVGQTAQGVISSKATTITTK